MESLLDKAIRIAASGTISDSAQPIPTHTEESAPVGGSVSLEDDGSEVPSSLREFCEARAPGTDIEYVAVIAAYARDYEGRDEFSAGDLLPYVTELSAGGMETPSNVRNGIWNAAGKSRGYMERVPGKRGVYRLTEKGAALVYGSGEERV